MKIWKEIAVLTPIIIIAGLFKHIVYYAFFNVPIVHFLELNEVPVLFSEDIIYIILLFILMICLGHFGSRTKTGIQRRRFYIKFYKEEEIILRIFSYFTNNYFNVLAIFLMVLAVGLNFWDYKEMRITTQYLILIDSAYFLSRFIILEVKRDIYINSKLKKEDETMENNFYLFVVAVNLILIFTVQEVERVKYDLKYSNVKVITNSETLSSDSTQFYIGRTKNYLFFYNAVTDISRVIPSSRIEEIDFGRIPTPTKEKVEGNKPINSVKVIVDTVPKTDSSIVAKPVLR